MLLSNNFMSWRNSSSSVCFASSLWLYCILKSVPLGCVKYLKVFYKGDRVTIKTEAIPLVWLWVFKMKNEETCIYKLPMVGKALVHLKKRRPTLLGENTSSQETISKNRDRLDTRSKKGHIENNSGFGTPMTELYREAGPREPYWLWDTDCGGFKWLLFLNQGFSFSCF